MVVLTITLVCDEGTHEVYPYTTICIDRAGCDETNGEIVVIDGYIEGGYENPPLRIGIDDIRIVNR